LLSKGERSANIEGTGRCDSQQDADRPVAVFASDQIGRRLDERQGEAQQQPRRDCATAARLYRHRRTPKPAEAPGVATPQRPAQPLDYVAGFMFWQRWIGSTAPKQ
jgi:hypothetical protein